MSINYELGANIVPLIHASWVMLHERMPGGFTSGNFFCVYSTRLMLDRDVDVQGQFQKLCCNWPPSSSPVYKIYKVT